MHQRLTDRARAVIESAQEAARSCRYNYVGTEHILLGLLRTPSAAAEVLESTGMTAPWVEANIAESAGPTIGEKEAAVATPFRGRPPFAPRAKKVLDFAWREARGLRQESVDAEHILLGLMLEQDGGAARILRECGTDPAEIRAEAFRRLPSTVTQTPRPESADIAAFSGFIRVGSTPPTRRLLMAAAEQALDDGRSAFDAGDLLIAIARDETFAPLLAGLGIDKATAYDAVKGWRLPEERSGPPETV
jgi:ATP-dependent Clp protease ATP-binding subunit ClpA